MFLKGAKLIIRYATTLYLFSTFTFSQGYNNNLKIKPNSSLQHNCAVEFVWAKYNSENKLSHVIKIHVNNYKARTAELRPPTWDLAENIFQYLNLSHKYSKAYDVARKAVILVRNNKEVGSHFVQLDLILRDKSAPKEVQYEFYFHKSKHRLYNWGMLNIWIIIWKNNHLLIFWTNPDFSSTWDTSNEIYRRSAGRIGLLPCSWNRRSCGMEFRGKIRELPFIEHI